jgi:competence protein ComEC
MFSWTPYPFFRIVLFFSAGILLGIYQPDLLNIQIITILFGILAAGFVVIAILKSTDKLKALNPGLAGLVMVFLAGYIQVFHSTDYRSNHHIARAHEPILNYRAVITKQAQEKENSWKIEAEVTAVQFQNGWQERTGKVLLYFSKQSYEKPFAYGDVVLVNGSPQIISEPANPGEFDYKRFLTFRKIYHQHFLRAGDAMYIGHESPSHFINYSIQARVWATDVLNQYITGEREQATASALVLGVTDGLDNDLLSAYAATGSLHVLSVSGLHVGIMYWLILLLLKPLNKTVTGKWTLAVISIVVLWGYAFVTGLSPSVLRAVTMFSFVAVARPWSKRTNIYNTLAASAFCLLLYEPYLIMSVGFQLSYLAVVGIVYLQPILSRVWQPKQWLWDQVWQITCVSIAAQLATCALGLLYFHQFPVYFLFSNLFVIPLSFVVLIAGITLIALSAVAPLAGLLGLLLQWTVWFLNYGVFKLEALPFSLIDNVYITTFQCWVLMTALVFSVFLFRFRKFSMAVAVCISIIMFSILQWNHFYEEVDVKKFTVYKVSGFSAVDMIDRGQAFTLLDSGLMSNRESIRFHIRPNRLISGVSAIYPADQLGFIHEYTGCRVVLWNELSILQIQGKDFSYPPILVPDYVILGNNAIRDWSDISALKFQKLILDSSNSFYFADRILKEAQQASVHVHSVLHHGAFTAKF